MTQPEFTDSPENLFPQGHDSDLDSDESRDRSRSPRTVGKGKGIGAAKDGGNKGKGYQQDMAKNGKTGEKGKGFNAIGMTGKSPQKGNVGEQGAGTQSDAAVP